MKLQAEEMAALANDHDAPLVFPDSAGVGAAARSGGKGSRKRSRRTSSLGREFVTDLGAIAE
jgi:hypothetical protein